MTCSEDNFKKMLSGGIKDAGECFAEEVNDLALDPVEDAYDTALGKLNKSLYGYLHSITSGDGVGATLTKAGISCIVKTTTNSNEGNPVRALNKSLPTVDDMITGAQDGFGLGNSTREKATLVQIKSKCGLKCGVC